MNFKSKIFLVLSFLMLLVVFLQPALSVNASSSKILQPAFTDSTFTPTTVGKQSYYIVNSGTDYPVIYQNNLPATFEYSTASASSYGSSSSRYSNNYYLQSTASTNKPVTPTNPFLQANTSYNVPNVVQIDNNNSQLLSGETKPFSLHMDQSMTFYLGADIPNVAVLKESSNLLLDVNVKDTNSHVDSYLFNFKTNQYDYFNQFSSQSTVPVFNTNNKNDTYIFKFVSSNANAIMTVTPHKLSTNDYPSSNVNVNTTASYTVTQGACLDNSKTNSNNFDLTSLNSFTFNVDKDTYYQIYVDNSQTDTRNNLCNNNNQYGSVSPTLLNSTTDFQFISGSLDSAGYTFQATSNGSMTLIVQNNGYLRRDVSVFFRSITKPAPAANTVPIQLNKDVTLITNEYNTFTIASPSLLSINQTNQYSSTYVPSYPLYTYNTTTQQWDSLTSFYTYGTQALRPVEGNLVSFNSNNLPNTNWIYVPSGKYAIKPTSNYYTNYYNYHFTFNVVKVNEIGSTGSQTFDVNNNTLLAVQYTRNDFNFNMLNLTSTTHDNVSVSYEVNMVNKYLDYSPSFNPYYTSPYLGNQKTSGGWVQYASNSTILYQNVRLTDPDLPIFIIHPYLAENTSSLASLNSFNTQLTITSQSLTNNTSGYYMIHSSVLTGSDTVPINQDFTTSTSQVHYFKLNTQSDTLYNLTLITKGNYTNAGAQNISINSYSVYNGVYNDISLPFGSTSSSQIMNTTESSLILTQAGTAYLEVDLNRNYNGTLTIELTKITSNSLAFPNSINPSTLTWNKTISQFEVHDKNTLLKVIKPKGSSTPGFEFLPIFMALILIPIYKKYKKVNGGLK